MLHGCSCVSTLTFSSFPQQVQNLFLWSVTAALMEEQETAWWTCLEVARSTLCYLLMFKDVLLSSCFLYNPLTSC